MRSQEKIESKGNIWVLAARPKTLPAAAAPVIVGSAFAFKDGSFKLLPALAALIAALLLQIGANLANDMFDYYKGADTVGRLGPQRVTQAGLLTSKEVLAGMWIVFGLAAILGIYLYLKRRLACIDDRSPGNSCSSCVHRRTDPTGILWLR